MVRGLKAAAVLLLSVAAIPATARPLRWTQEDLAQLAGSVALARDEGLYESASSTAITRMAPGVNTDATADVIALDLARDFYEGSARIRLDASWHIPRTRVDYKVWLDAALAKHDVMGSLRALLPSTPTYGAIRDALSACRKRSRECSAFEVNLDRLRALPRDRGEKYLWVNVPAFRLDLIEHGEVVSSHKIIVGKTDTQTPIFRTTVTGVTINPWWNVPCSIVEESIGKLVRDHPDEAARRGFVASRSPDGKLSVRQKPGPNNALGRVKLEMANPYSVFIHDTPGKNLFLHDRRALSHGCIRTQNPDDLAIALLGNDKAIGIGLLVGSGISKTISLPEPLPVYVVYLTRDIDPATGKLASYDDIYRRDRE